MDEKKKSRLLARIIIRKNSGEVQALPLIIGFVILQMIKDYSMIVATRPEPTVLPPSRLLGAIFDITNHDKLWLFCLIFY